ncbi:hypothetical protein [Streptomyces sp. NPDC094472]|uniref:hypothetical protein n=1 Tax=Streptomyces sp. NPDC094472 TaxID=3155080 RepID=UPI00331656BD
MDWRVGDLAIDFGLMRVRGGPKTWVSGVDTGAHQGMDLRVLESLAPREMAADPPHEGVLGDTARYTRCAPARTSNAAIRRRSHPSTRRAGPRW